MDSEFFYSIVRLIWVFVGSLFGIHIAYNGLVSDVEGDLFKHSLVFIPLLFLSLWGARACLEDSGDLPTAIGYPLVYGVIVMGMNKVAGQPLAWLVLP